MRKQALYIGQLKFIMYDDTTEGSLSFNIFLIHLHYKMYMYVFSNKTRTRVHHAHTENNTHLSFFYDFGRKPLSLNETFDTNYYLC